MLLELGEVALVVHGGPRRCGGDSYLPTTASAAPLQQRKAPRRSCEIHAGALLPQARLLRENSCEKFPRGKLRALEARAKAARGGGREPRRGEERGRARAMGTQRVQDLLAQAGSISEQKGSVEAFCLAIDAAVEPGSATAQQDCALVVEKVLSTEVSQWVCRDALQYLIPALRKLSKDVHEKVAER